jgi:hypothetical protein
MISLTDSNTLNVLLASPVASFKFCITTSTVSSGLILDDKEVAGTVVVVVVVVVSAVKSNSAYAAGKIAVEDEMVIAVARAKVDKPFCTSDGSNVGDLVVTSTGDDDLTAALFDVDTVGMVYAQIGWRSNEAAEIREIREVETIITDEGNIACSID